jgi:hypothetical protein
LGAESLLSDIALDWMARAMQGEGMALSLPGVAKGAALGPSHRPWTKPPFNLRAFGPRALPKAHSGGLALHASVGERLGQCVKAIADAEPHVVQELVYAPSALLMGGYVKVTPAP